MVSSSSAQLLCVFLQAYWRLILFTLNLPHFADINSSSRSLIIVDFLSETKRCWIVKQSAELAKLLTYLSIVVIERLLFSTFSRFLETWKWHPCLSKRCRVCEIQRKKRHTSQVKLLR